jgi:hypothetical protein
VDSFTRRFPIEALAAAKYSRNSTAFRFDILRNPEEIT